MLGIKYLNKAKKRSANTLSEIAFENSIIF